MLNDYIKELTYHTFDFVRIYDFDFFNKIEFEKCSEIVRNIRDNLSSIGEFNNFTNIISYKYNDLFFSELEFEIIQKDSEDYIDTPCKLTGISWNINNDKLAKIKMQMFSVAIPENILSIRHSLLIAYYEYLNKINKDHVFVRFIDYAADLYKIDYINENVFRILDKIALDERSKLIEYSNNVDFFL